MRALDRKLLRDLWRLKWQAGAISLLVACGVSVAVMAFSAQEALKTAQSRYYAQTRFADVFATAKRAPLAVARELASLDGVVAVDARAMQGGLMEVPGQIRPATARLISLPEDDRTALNRLVMMQGRLPDPNRSDEVVALKTFLDAAHVRLGDHLAMVVDGRRFSFRIVGSALSPEFVYVPSPASSMPDDAHQGVFWAPRPLVENATGLGGAFSTIALKLSAGASEPAVLAAVDRALAPYGGAPSVGKGDQVSNKFQEDRISRLGIIAWVIPPVFLMVAAGLVQMVLGRVVEAEREQIGLLKAFGYSDLAAASVYLRMAALIGLAGALAGGLIGGWMGGLITGVLAQYMRFPDLPPRFSWAALAVASAISVGAAVAGSLLAVRKAARLSPAVAMRPPAPKSYRRGLFERFAFWRALDQPTRMIIRNLERFPGRAAITAAGLGVSVSLLIGSQFMFGSLDEIVDQAYYRARHWTDIIGFVEARDARAAAEVARLPGVMSAELVRNAPATVRAHGLEHKAALFGIDPGARLDRLLDADGRPLPLEGRGVILSEALADRLMVRAGDPVELEVTEGRRPRTLARVTAISRDYAGLTVSMARTELNRLMGDGDVASGAHLLVAADRRADFYRAIARTPQVVGGASRDDTVAEWRDSMARAINVEMSFYVGLAAAIAFAVAYNTSRIAMADRSRDLATLRVLGFDQIECAYILLGELLLLAVIALPIGVLGGIGISRALAAAFAHEDIRFPLVITARSYGMSFVAYFVAVILAAILVGQRIWALDLVAVLKTRD